MGLLSSFAWSQLTELPHPTINEKQCVNRFRRRHCTACVDICPEQVIGRDLKVKSWASCIDCGRCASTCETRAITPSERQLNQLLPLRNVQEDAIWLGCDRSERTNDLVRTCLCELTWEHLAHLGFYKKLVLDLAPCMNCEETACRDLLSQNLQQLHSFYGPQRFGERVILAKDAATAPRSEREISRRDMLEQSMALSKNGMKTLLKHYPMLSPEELKLDGVSARKLLHAPMKQENEDYFWEIPAVKNVCIGCGICVKKCPTTALRMSEDGEMLILDPWRCVNCKSCEMNCSRRVFRGTERIRIQNFSPLRLCGVQKITCRVCGAVMRAKTPNGLCNDCLQKRMQEVAARRRKEKEETE